MEVSMGNVMLLVTETTGGAGDAMGDSLGDMAETYPEVHDIYSVEPKCTPVNFLSS